MLYDILTLHNISCCCLTTYYITPCYIPSIYIPWYMPCYIACPCHVTCYVLCFCVFAGRGTCAVVHPPHGDTSPEESIHGTEPDSWPAHSIPDRLTRQDWDDYDWTAAGGGLGSQWRRPQRCWSNGFNVGWLAWLYRCGYCAIFHYMLLVMLQEWPWRRQHGFYQVMYHVISQQ